MADPAKKSKHNDSEAGRKRRMGDTFQVRIEEREVVIEANDYT
jgi:hypothetical protein